MFRDANWAEKLLAAELQLWWKCPCCSDTLKQNLANFSRHAFFLHHLKLIEDSRKWKNADKRKMKNMGIKWKGGGGLHMWVFPNIKVSKNTAREELIPDDNVHM